MRYMFAVLLLLVSGVALAQDTTELEPVNACTEEDTTAFFTGLADLVASTEGTLFERLDTLQAAINSQRWLCSGMVISGEDVEGSTKVVVGPYTIPDGIYRVKLTTEDFFILRATELSGNCRLSFAVVEGEASAGTESIFEYDDDCTLLLEVEARAPWEIVFVPVGGGD